MSARAVMAGCVAGLSLVAGPRLEAQRARPGLRSTGYVGVGYVASVPTTPLGFAALATTPRVLHGAGLYADVKLTTSSPSTSAYYHPTVTVLDAEVTFGDLLYENKSDWITVDLGVVYAVTADFAVYGGGGYSKETHYRQYFDETQTRGNFGFYWIADPVNSGTRVNIVAGALARVRRFLFFQLGGESQPRAVNIGLMLTLAR